MLLREVERLLRFHDETVGEHGGHEAQPPDPGVPASVGDFTVLGVLGRGGMGIIYLAQRGDEPPVALKVLRPGSLSPALLSRFHREAEALSRLRHPGIAHHLESGLVEVAGGAQPYFAMEFVEGEDLRGWAAGARPLEERLELLARVCDAVQHAHEHGVVHRDLKPENILVRRDGSPCVLDFGVARITESDYRATTLMTATGVLVGTIRYMSPEQADARPGGIDARSDVYTLGVIVHELVSGRMPYEVPADSIHRALLAVLMAAPEALPRSLGRRGRALDLVVGKALAKDAGGRYASAAELAADLRRVASGRRPLARVARRPLAVPRVVLVLAASVVAAFAAGRWLGDLQWFRDAAPRLGGGDARSAAVLALLDSAAVRIFTTPQAPGRVQAGIATCDSARVRLARFPDREVAKQFERLAWTLSMEAHLGLADLGFEPGEYEASIAAGGKAIASAARAGSVAILSIRPGPLHRFLAEGQHRVPEAVMAVAAGQLGHYSQPWTQRSRALAWNQAALELVDRRATGGVDQEAGVPSRADAFRDALLAHRAILLARAGDAADSAAQVREALDLIDDLSAAHPRSADRVAARLQLRAGTAWGVLGRIEERQAAFDSSLSRLVESVARSRASGRSLVELESRLALAETLRWRARTRAARSLARNDLAAARRTLEEGLAGPPGGLHPRAGGLLRLRLAQVELDLAVLGDGAARAETAFAGLARVEPLFPPTTHPVQASDIELERARASAYLWTLTGDRFMRDAARRRLESALALVPAAEDPGRARRAEAGIEALREEVPPAADLWRPVASGPLSAARRAALDLGRPRSP